MRERHFQITGSVVSLDLAGQPESITYALTLCSDGGPLESEAMISLTLEREGGHPDRFAELADVPVGTAVMYQYEPDGSYLSLSCDGFSINADNTEWPWSMTITRW